MIDHSWLLMSVNDTQHVIPNNDLKPHSVTTMCWCKPETDADFIWVHNSMDTRERYENGELRPH